MSEFYQRLALLSSNRILELHVLPTENCNFRCTYCYEDFAVGRMKPDTVAALKAFIRSRVSGLDVLNVSWFGGEPLVARDIVLDISRFARGLCEDSGCRFFGGATTNAWFLDLALARSLIAAGVTSYQITLDGPAEVHDRTRLRKGGGGSFARIWENLAALRASALPFQIMLRLHITPDTAASVLEWMPHLKRTLLCDGRFSVLVKPIEHLGGPNDEHIATFASDADREAAVGQIYAALGADGPPRRDLFATTCYAARPNAWVVRANGTLAKCTVALNDPRNTVGRLRDDGTLELEERRLKPWFAGLQNLDPEVLGCPLSYLEKSA